MSKESPKKTKEKTDDGKTIVKTEYPDGRKDVNIGVNRLDVKDEDPEVVEKANQAIKKALSNQINKTHTLVIVLHKPTEDYAAHITKVDKLRGFAQAAIEKHGGEEADKDDYVVMAFEFGSLQLNVVKL